MTFVNYYEVLGLDKESFTGKNEDQIQREIKLAHRKQMLKKHPDKGGTNNQFQELTKAKEILQDPIRRVTYDEEYELFVPKKESLGTNDINKEKFENWTDRRYFIHKVLGTDLLLYSEKIEKLQKEKNGDFSSDYLINKLWNDEAFRDSFRLHMKGRNDEKVRNDLKDGIDSFINNVEIRYKPEFKYEEKFQEKEDNESEISDDDISQPDENESDIFDISDDSDELELSESSIESVSQAKSVSISMADDKMQEQEELSNPFAKIPNGDKVLKAYHRVLDIITDIDLKRIYKQEKSYQKATNQVNLVELTNKLCADSNFAQRFITYIGKNNDEEIRGVIKGGKENFFSAVSGQEYKQPKLFRQPTKLEVPHDFNDWNEEKEQKDPIIRSLRIIKTSRDLGVTRANRVSSRELVFAIADDLDFRNRFFMKFQNSSGEELGSALWCNFEVFKERLKQDDSLNSTMGKELEEIEQSPIVRTLKSFNNLAQINSEQAGEDLWNALSKIVENEEFEKKFITIANSIDDEELEKLFMRPFKHVEKFVNDDSIYVSIQIQKEIMRIYQENDNDDKYEANLHEEYKEKALEIVQRSKEDETRSNLIRGLLDRKDRDARKDFLDKFLDDIICEQHSPTSSASSPFAESKAPSLDESKSSAK